MNDNNILIKELANRINQLVNIPLINEQNEQAFFELVISILLGIFLDEVDKQILKQLFVTRKIQTPVGCRGFCFPQILFPADYADYVSRR